MPPHTLTNFEIQKHYQNQLKFNSVYSRNNLSKINLDEYESIEAHWIAFYVNAENITDFDSFAIEHISKEIRKLIESKNIITNIYRIQAYHSIICGYFCIGFIDFMLKDKILRECTNLFSPNKHEKNDKIILKYFQ